MCKKSWFHMSEVELQFSEFPFDIYIYLYYSSEFLLILFAVNISVYLFRWVFFQDIWKYIPKSKCRRTRDPHKNWTG